MSVRVRVHFSAGKGRKAHTATFTKPGTKAALCKVTTIRIKGKVFRGRRGGRTLCGPSTGKNSPGARAARRAFTAMVKRSRRHGRRSRR
jgi:hypothetical protein